MSKLVIHENKRLSLKKVIIHELRNIELENLEIEIEKFINYIQILKIQSYGPLITKLIGTNIHDDETLTFDYDLMVQAHDYHLLKGKFKIKEEYSCNDCIYTRFEGKSEYLSYAHSKIDLHLYENELETNGVVYTIFLSDTPDKMVVDIFKPVIRNETL